MKTRGKETRVEAPPKPPSVSPGANVASRREINSFLLPLAALMASTDHLHCAATQKA